MPSTPWPGPGQGTSPPPPPGSKCHRRDTAQAVRLLRFYARELTYFFIKIGSHMSNFVLIFCTGKVFPKLRRKGSRMSKDGSRSPVHNRSVSSLQSMGSSGSSNLSVQMSEDGTEGENMISGTEEDEATDYVFRIITTFKPENLRKCASS